jgi:RNA polymerase sigma-70 factor (ECF subfamily)
MAKLTDEQLAVKTLENKKYFEQLVDKYATPIQRYIARVTGNWSDSEDLTQEVFFKAYKNIASFNVRLKFSSWLYRIAHNESVNFIKKHYRTRNVEFNDNLKNRLTEENKALEKIINDENAVAIKKAIVKLKMSDKEILELAFFEEKSYLEIADILEISVNSVGPKIKRAKDNLKKIINISNE